MGVHQKIDRIAHRSIKPVIPRGMVFPSTQQVLHFEGLNGPDGIKRKSPAKDEPWHYIDPNDPDDRQLMVMISDHIYNLSAALSGNNLERAAFEAAWLAHAITDGLTPAHHYPLEGKLEELRGEGIETRVTTRAKLLLPGKNRRAQLRNNWEYWGARGVMTTHLAFEIGVATTIAAQRLDTVKLDATHIKNLQQAGFEAVFFTSLQKIAGLKMYDEFSRQGWTRQLANETRRVLVPAIIHTVALGWYQAILEAKQANAAADN